MLVNFFPRKDINVDICDIKNDSKCAVVQCTDTITQARAYYVEYLSLKYNVRPTAFINPTYGDLGDAATKELMEAGWYGHGLYFTTAMWSRPLNGIIGTISDYNLTEWTALGVADFGATLGATKPTRYPNHGQEMFDVSGGKLGYDVINGTAGESNQEEFKAHVKYQSNWYLGITGVKPFSISFMNGQNPSPVIYIQDFITGRNSVYNQRTAYGISKVNGAYLGSPDVDTSRLDRISQATSTRWADQKNVSGEIVATANLNASMADAIDKKGIFSNFGHDHSTTPEDLETLYTLISNGIGSEDVWRCSFAEAFSYFWYRELTRRAVATIIGDYVYITLEWNDVLKDQLQDGLNEGFDYSALFVPLSVKIDLTGTPLEGKEIKNSGGNVVSKGGNVFVVDVPFGNLNEGMKGVRLSEADTEDYVQNSRPVILVVKTGDTLNVTTDISTKAVLFSKGSSETDDKYVVTARDNKLSKSHEFTIESGKIYRVGAYTTLQGDISNEIG